MTGFLTELLDSDLTPHGFCLAWQPGLLWLEAGADAVVALAYYSIPLAMMQFARKRRDMAFPWMIWLFASFILACGTTHVLGIATLWLPLYWLDAGVKAVTAVLSLTTAILLWPMLPRALALPSPVQLHELNRELSHQVAEREAIATSLRISEARLRSFYAHTPAPLHALDMEGRVVAVSERWLELLGYKRHEVIGTCIIDFNSPDTRDRFRAEWDEMLRTGEIRDRERCMMTRAGEHRIMLVSARLERDEFGKITHVVAALTDITERKQTEEALRESEDCLRQAQKMEAVGQLTGGIAHDFNNMLTGVMGSMELVQRRLPSDDRSRRLLETALQGATRAARLTSQLLSFSRRQRLVAEVLEPARVVDGMADLLRRTLGERIAFAVETPETQPWCCLADRNQVEAALLNLVLNARAATHGDGRVTLRFGNRPVAAGDAVQPGEEPVAPGDYVSIAVIDTGTGMPEETRRRAFEPFFTTKPAGEGTGLGLSQIYGFARQSGGTARIFSRVGMGTTVEILLPRAREEHGVAHNADEARAEPPRGHGETVLLVEDENSLRLMATEALHDSGYRVVAARDADEAMTLLDGDSGIDVLFTDIVMPGQRNGVELALEVRRRRPGMPVLFATGYSDRRVLARWPGQIDLMAKPYTVDELTAHIAACVARRAPDLAEV